MRKLLPIAPLLLYAGIILAASPAAPTTPGLRSLTAVFPDTTLLPITTLVSAPITHTAPAGRLSTAGQFRTAAAAAHLPVGPNHSATASGIGRSRVLLLRLSNPSPTQPIAYIALEWELQVNGMSRQKGMTGNLTITPRQSILVRLPAHWPGNDSNEVFLRLRYRRATAPSRPQGSHPVSHIPPATPPGPVLAEEQLLVQAPAGNTLEVRPDGELTFTDVNDTFNIQSPLIHIGFNKQTGWPQRYEANGAVLLIDTPVLKAYFWRPSLPGNSASAWQEASQDPHLQLFSTSTGNTMIIVRAEYTLPPTSCLLHVSYTINAKGEMLVTQQLEADSTQKGEPLPCFGMRWLLPASYDSIEYYGLDRMDDSASAQDSNSSDTAIGNARDSVRLHEPWVGIYRDTFSRQPTSPDSHQRNPSVTNGIITAIRWIRISGPDGSGLLITADSTLFNAGALQITPSILLNIDSRQPAPTGIPGDNRQISYGLPYGNYRCTYKISPVSSRHAAFTDHH